MESSEFDGSSERPCAMGEEKGRRKKTREEQVGGALARMGALHGGCVSTMSPLLL
jgi:hypothetical protein